MGLWTTGHGRAHRDGGAHWTRDTIPGAGALDLRAIAATSATTAHAISIGDSSRVYRTTDGGRTWSLRWSATRKGTFLDAIRFWDARHGIAMSDPVDGKLLLIVTSDGGESWQEIPAERLPPALQGEGGFAASGTCLAVYGDAHVWIATGGAASARVYHSADRGATWTVHDTPLRAGVPSAGVFSVAFRDARHGVIAGGDYEKPSAARSQSRDDERRRRDVDAHRQRSDSRRVSLGRGDRTRHASQHTRRRRTHRHRRVDRQWRDVA